MVARRQEAPGRRGRRAGWAAAAAVALVAGVGCSSSRSTSIPPTSIPTPSTGAKNFTVTTPEGSASLSLDGRLPPVWPADFPVPPGATPAGSGSLATTGKGAAVAVFNAPQTPPQTFTFYSTNHALSVERANALGAGSAYVGRVQISSPWKGSVTVLPDSSASMAVVVLTSTGQTTGGSASTTTQGSTAQGSTAQGSTTTKG